MTSKTVQIEFLLPPIRLRLKWWLIDTKLRLEYALHLKRHLTTDEWYAAGCPPVPGVPRYYTPKSFRKAERHLWRTNPVLSAAREARVVAGLRDPGA